MNVPLNWLSEYVTLPKSEKELTDRLTMVGHMLDKRKEVNGEVVIDLELRGNRADMFGLIGVARDISALFHTPLRMPDIAELPPVDDHSPLLHVEKNMDQKIKRFMAISLNVTVGPSPQWLADRLIAYGIDPINNVVDVTNYVMVETGHPMHAFDVDTMSGNQLTLRLAKPGETFETIQQGTTLRLTKEDIAIADKTSVQSITCIGGLKTKVTDRTKTIILETAVYDAPSSRRTARRHKVMTEGGGRHEKHQDPHELPFVLARAIRILQDVANARVIGKVSEYYPHPTPPTTIDFDISEVQRLGGMEIPKSTIIDILNDLGCQVSVKKAALALTIPTFRTDIEESADIVEEIIRVHGYEKIPVKTLGGILPEPATPATVRLEEEIRDHMVRMQMNEVITASIIENKLVPLYEQTDKFPATIQLVNAPDPDIATLRPSLLPNLVAYAKRSIGFRQNRIALFEIGRRYRQIKKSAYTELPSLGIVLGGVASNTSWNKHPRSLTLYDLKGVIEGILENLGIAYTIRATTQNPSMDPKESGRCMSSDGVLLGEFGKLHPNILNALGIHTDLFVAELSVLGMAQTTKSQPQPYTIAPLYPPLIEDLSFTIQTPTRFGEFLIKGRTVDPRIASLVLLDAYENKRTIRIIYEDAAKTLTTQDILPIRQSLIQIATSEFSLQFQEG